MSNIFDMEGVMTSLSYREKSLYCALCVEMLIYIPYFIHVAKTPVMPLEAMLWPVALLIVSLVVVETVLAITTRNRRTDERDCAINIRSSRVAYVALILSIAGIFGALGTRPYFAASWIANALLGSVAVAYTSQLVTQLVMYRRTA